MTLKNERIWEIDFFRGIALILMIIFHTVFDLGDIYNIPVAYDAGLFYYIGNASAILFILISGISCSLSKSNVKRGIRVFVIAMIITTVSYLYDPDLTIKFGILHFLGISMLLYPLFKPLNKYELLVLGTLMIMTGIYISKFNMPFDYLFPIGLKSSEFISGDYYPLLPWLGLFLYGVSIGRFLYSEKKSIFSFNKNKNPVSFIGRHTLLIYIIHQPVILLILKMVIK